MNSVINNEKIDPNSFQEFLNSLSSETVIHPEVIYQDNHLLVLAKPASIPVVPDSSRDISLLDLGKRYIRQTKGKKGNVFLGVVHRLDRPVSGVVCFALTSKAASRISEQMRRKAIKKTYIGLSHLRPKEESGVMRHWILKNRKKNIVSLFNSQQEAEKAREAVTRWEYAGMKKGLHMIRLYPETGRPHQLRSQCATIGIPLAGDKKYGSPVKFQKGRIGLHALSLELMHPVKKEMMIFTTPFII